MIIESVRPTGLSIGSGRSPQNSELFHRHETSTSLIFNLIFETSCTTRKKSYCAAWSSCVLDLALTKLNLTDLNREYHAGCSCGWLIPSVTIHLFRLIDGQQAVAGLGMRSTTLTWMFANLQRLALQHC